jgi:DNA-binding transcriptional regulator LsrR (DeoR family)
MIRSTLALSAEADVTFVGIGDLGPDAPLFVDGFIDAAELRSLREAGAVAEIVGWAIDAEGRPIEGMLNDRVASSPIPPRDRGLVIGIAKGRLKLPGIAAALKGGLINALITDEETAAALLGEASSG